MGGEERKDREQGNYKTEKHGEADREIEKRARSKSGLGCPDGYNLLNILGIQYFATLCLRAALLFPR